MSESILTSTKKILGISEDYEAFDSDIITHINSALSTLHQLGVGPVEGFMIEDKTAEWSSFLGLDPRFNMVKQYVYLKVRLVFDAPTSGYAMDAQKQQIQELEWRLNVVREGDDWVDPNPLPIVPEEV